MESYDLNMYMPIVILMSFAIVMVGGALLVGSLLRPKNPSEIKQTAYECGELPVGSAWSNFHVRFYVVALVFIIFDVEGALMFPLAVVFNRFVEVGMGGPAIIIFLLFISVLLEGIVYCWKKGDLDWVRSFQIKVPEGKDDSRDVTKESA